MPAFEDARLPSDRLFLESSGFESGKSRILYGYSLKTFGGVYFCPLGFVDELLEDVAGYMDTCDNVVIKIEPGSPGEPIYETYSALVSEDPTKQWEKSLFVNPYADDLLRAVSSHEVPRKVSIPEPDYPGCNICGLKSRHTVGYVCAVNDPFQRERAQSRQFKRAAVREAPRVERGPRHVYTANPKYQGAQPSCPILVQVNSCHKISTIKLDIKIAAELVRAYEVLKAISTDVDNPVQRTVDALQIQKDAVQLPHWLNVAMTKEDANELEDYLRRIHAIVDESNSSFRSLRIAMGGIEKEQSRNREGFEHNEQDVKMANFEAETQAKAQGKNSMPDYEMLDTTQSNMVNNLAQVPQVLRAPPKTTKKKTVRKLQNRPFVLDEDDQQLVSTSSYDADHEGSTPERT